MKRLPPHRYAAILALGCALLPASRVFAFNVQDEGSPTAVLLSRARTLEQRGRLDLAKQDWAQVLLLEPSDAEALAGLVRASRAEGRNAEAAVFLARLRAAHPKDPELARLEASGGKGHDNASDLAEAERLARSGDNRGAFAIYRRVYGLTPPPGAPAISYFQSEAATEEGRPQAIAGLRAMADRYPTDSRYRVALGRVLLTSPRTRAEGRTILEDLPGNQEALSALRGAQGGTEVAAAAGASSPPRWPETAMTQQHAAEPAPKPIAKPAPGTPMASSEVAQRTSPRPAADIARKPTTVTRSESPVVSSAPSPQPSMRAVSTQNATHHQAFAAQEQAGFAALNQHRAADAEQLFREILTKDPNNPRALAGLGYLRVTTGDLKSAVTLFEQAQENGDRSLALTRALVNAQFDFSLQRASAARTKGDLSGAETQYRTALRERPSDPEALDGLATVLLQAGRPQDAIPVFARLTQVRPMNPGAWRGLVIAQASAGQGANALSTDARVPADAKAPLLGDSSYLQALTTARGAAGTQVAKVENPPPTSSRAAAAPPNRASSATQTSQVTAPPPAPNRPAPAVAIPVPAPVAAPSPTPAKPPAATQAAGSSATATSTVPKASEPASSAAVPQSSPTPNHPAEVPGPPAVASVKPPAIPPAKVSTSTHPSRKSNTLAKNAAPPAPVPPSTPAPVAPAPVPALRNNEVIAAERVMQGEDALIRGEAPRAASLFRDAIASQPNRPDAWKGLVRALQASGRDGEAVSALAQVPDVTRGVLDRDATFQSVVGAVYLGTDRPSEALRAFVRAQEVFASQKLPPPLDLALRIATLLASRSDDGNLYQELIYLGNRRDLNDAQRRDVQMIWTTWAVRRARALAAAGEQRRAVVVLNAAAEAFAGNPAVLSAVASGYAGVGLPREAVALYKGRDLTNAPARELEAAVEAGIAAHDYRSAEVWAKAGRERFPQDPEMLTAVAALEQARGHEQRAEELARQARALAPAQDPGQVLTAELWESRSGIGARQDRAGKLSVLLAPADANVQANGAQASRPFLPATADFAGASRAEEQTPVLSGYTEPGR